MRKALLLFVLSSLSLNISASSHPSIFHRGSVADAQNKARTEGKIQLLEFVAKWCTPCKFMDQTTFQDQKLVAFMKENYVSVKVDIDDLEGFSLKEKYGVQFLPTIILIDTEGNVLEKIEEAVGSRKLLGILETYNMDSFKKVTDGSAVAAPSPVSTTSHSPTPPPSRRTQQVQHESNVVVAPSPKVESKNFGEPDAPRTYWNDEAFILQFGAFASLSNANEHYEKLTAVLPSSPELKSKVVDGQAMFILQYGPYYSRSEAELVKKELERLGVEAFVKPLE